VLSSTTVTANGQDGPLTLHAGSPLHIAIAANGGTAGFANPSDVYLVVSAPFGLLWLDSSGFTTTATPLNLGPLANFGPTTFLSVSNVSSLPSGTYSWFIVVTGASGTFPTWFRRTFSRKLASAEPRPFSRMARSLRLSVA
jgi:hypothetical protein